MGKYVHAFVIAFKQGDNRMTNSLRSMISLFEKMFGKQFWDNVILEATHWNFGEDAIRIRNESSPPLTRHFWTAEFNRILRSEFSLKRNLTSVFIDTFYHDEDELETRQFQQNSEMLLKFALSRRPFQCKDIEVALTEIRELKNEINKLVIEDENKDIILKELEVSKSKLQSELTEYQSQKKSEEASPKKGSFCSYNKCYTPSEFGLFGAGAGVLGILLGVLTISWYKQQCLPDEKEELKYNKRQHMRQQPQGLMDEMENSELYSIGRSNSEEHLSSSEILDQSTSRVALVPRS